ncbi:trehalose utilization protein ThuA [Paenibacillus sp. MY03]|jgi:trehalose utilization protein|uniref:ThuA domain-containing protein n=1 Tax=Paenibacillus sp. MY03 TaxID=302980 RepID=UPI000B3D4EFB|nr:ThuA domain-containing protein [Paenibacillus sp. MY03]OUS76733.1 trehalose utilization protein ThuA [Paenibacillus sp. MY03]
MIRVTVWNEYYHEKVDPRVSRIYPEGMHHAIANGITSDSIVARTATQDQEEHGLTHDVLAQTDVLIWWGHMLQETVEDSIVDRVHKRVLEGMGLIVLHSGHVSKLFRKLMGTGCGLSWRIADEKERLWVVDPAHPIADGLGKYIELEQEEMYGEHFDIPAPDELIFVSWFEGGEVFRSGCAYRRNKGKIFYFRPGHETYPTYHNKDILKVISNAVKWAAPTVGADTEYGERLIALESIKGRGG